MATQDEIVSEISLSVSRPFEGKRLDIFLSSNLDEFSRSYLKGLVLKGLITLNGNVPKPSKAVHENDEIEIKIPVPELCTAEPEDIPLNIVFEDSEIIVLIKPPNLVVHPAPGHPNGTLVNALLYHCEGNLSAINGVLRPGIVHRLDKNTSGLIVCAKTDTALLSISKQFADRVVDKEYVALVHGKVTDSNMTIDLPLGRHRSDFRKISVREDVGKKAVTKIISQKTYGNVSVVHVKLLTGRTHQIRVHLKHVGCPLLCDDLYGKETQYPKKAPILSRCALHSYYLGFTHPTTLERVSFKIPLPDDIQELLEYLEANERNEI